MDAPLWRISITLMHLHQGRSGRRILAWFIHTEAFGGICEVSCHVSLLQIIAVNSNLSESSCQKSSRERCKRVTVEGRVEDNKMSMGLSRRQRNAYSFAVMPISMLLRGASCPNTEFRERGKFISHAMLVLRVGLYKGEKDGCIRDRH